MYSKSQAAFILSAKKMFEVYPRVYFWTFTFRKTMADWYYPQCWNAFSVKLQTFFAFDLYGVRVLEVHPGGHGLHYHALFNKRIAVQIVRRFGASVGIGNIHVRRAERDDAYYLAKYLTKKDEIYSGMRRWASVGGFKSVKKSQIIVDSAFSRNMKLLTGGQKVSIMFTSQILRFSQVFGDYEDWPEPNRLQTGKFTSG